MNNVKIEKGSSRNVLLIWKYAIKFPRLNSWVSFLKGLLGNLTEKHWYKFKSEQGSHKLCPILFSFPLGLFIVMPRCQKLTVDEFLQLDLKSITGNNEYYMSCGTMFTRGGLPVEHKISSLGKLNSRIVIIDYGGHGY